MQFDFAKLPKNKPLSLCEMVTFLAWGEAMTGDELREFGHPAERAQKSEWDAQLEECRKQAITDLELSSDEEERRTQAVAGLDLSGLLFGIDETWPAACQQLHQRWHRAQQQLNRERARLDEAAETWRQAAFYGDDLKVSGRPFGAEPSDLPVEIPRARFKHYRPDWASDVIEPNWKASGSDRPKRRRENPSYYDVNCSREGFVEWLKKREDANQRAGAEAAQSADADTSKSDASPSSSDRKGRASRPVRHSPSVESAREAVAAVYPDGVPSTVRAKERNNALNDWAIANGRRELRERTINRAISGR